MRTTSLKTILLSCVLLVSMTLLLADHAAAQQYDPQAEDQLVQLINQERARQGLPSLKVDERLTRAARAHCVLMAQAKQLSHQFPNEPKLSKRLAATNLRFNNDGENVAYDYSLQAAHQGLMHSPPHRANILSPKYNTVGVGVVRSGDVLWVTEDFAHQLQEYSLDDAENAVIAAFERERRSARNAPAKVVRMAELRRMACSMGREGRLDSRAPLSLRDADSSVVYTESEPGKLPGSAIKMAHDPSIKRFAVGACFADNAQFPAGVWWVAMVFFV